MAIQLTITPAAEKAFQDLRSERGAQYVRVWAGEACGCGRIGYRMSLEDQVAPTDLTIPAGGVQLVISPDSAPHLDGSTIDYFDDAFEAGFTIDNPQNQTGCGCGGHH
jgi:iron-sulfur cluster assembly protein